MLPDQFAAHELWAQLELTKEQLTEFEKSTGTEQQARINRIRFIINYAKSFDGVPGDYFTAPMLNRVLSEWANVTVALNQFAEGASLSNLDAAVDAAETCLEFIVQWPSPLSKGESLAQVTRTFRAYALELENSRNQVQDRLQEVIASIASLEQRVHDDSTSHESQLSKNGELLAALEAKILTDEARLVASIQKNDDAFQIAEKSRDVSLREWLLKQQEDFSMLAQPQIDQIIELLSRANKAYEEINKLRTDTTNVAALATGALLADNFAKSAKQERLTGFLTYIGGWLALIAGICVYLKSFGGVTVANLSWEAITIKFGISAVIVGGATVAFKLGGRSFKLSSKYKQTELELRAIGPFLADVPDTDASTTKTNFIERSFGQNDVRESALEAAGKLESKVFENVVTKLLGIFGSPSK